MAKSAPGTNKTALITGASRGLGKNMALALADDGHDIILTYRSSEGEARAVAEQVTTLGRRAAVLQLDTADLRAFPAFKDSLTQTLDATFKRKNIDFLINNAGIGATAPFAETSEKSFDALMSVHFKGVFFLTQSLLPLIADGGRIITISTGLTRFALPGHSAYAAMKGAVEVLTRHLAKELGPRKITVNTIAPGAIETDFTSEALSQPGARDRIAASTALGRIGEPDDIGGIAAFLCSDAARWITGQRIEASGGMFL